MKLNYPLIVGEQFVSHWNIGITNEQYHSDKSAVSSTALRKLLKSPYAFYNYHILGEKTEPTDAMQFGTIFHLALLEPEEFKKRFTLEPEFKGKGSFNAYYEWEKSLPLNSVVLSPEKYKDLIGMIESVKRHWEASAILKESLVEQSGYYRDPLTGILCKLRADFFHPQFLILGDVKTSTDCTVDSFSKTIWNYRLDIQLYMYTLGIQEIMGTAIKYPMFLVIEKKPPYEVALYYGDEDLIQSGKNAYEFCLNRLKVCLENDDWPGYQQSNQSISLPKWANYEDKI